MRSERLLPQAALVCTYALLIVMAIDRQLREQRDRLGELKWRLDMLERDREPRADPVA